MDKADHTMDNLLARYLLGEATDAEERQVVAWRKASAANERYFGHFRTIWEGSAPLDGYKETVDENEAWKRFQAYRQAQPPATPAEKAVPARLFFMHKAGWRIAAAIVLAVAGWWIYRLVVAPAPDNDGLVQARQQTVTDTLPDGSVVTLNRQSSLQYAKLRTGAARQVNLEGEAFFNIAPDKKRPFLIRVNGVLVRVVGTSFNVKSKGDSVEVIVETGIVQVWDGKGTAQLRPHEKVVAGKDRPAMQVAANTDELYSYYKTKTFVCNGTPLWRVAGVLNEAYDAHITVAPVIRDLPLTTTFREASLDEILSVISQTFNIRVEKKGQQVLLR